MLTTDAFEKLIIISWGLGGGDTKNALASQSLGLHTQLTLLGHKEALRAVSEDFSLFSLLWRGRRVGRVSGATQFRSTFETGLLQ